METNNKFSSKDVNIMSWVEMSELIDVLHVKINDYFKDKEEKINIISPLLRTGGIVGGILSIKMKILLMLPVQFKYFYKPTIIKQLISIPEVLIDKPKSMSILLCEGNTSSGSISVHAARVLKEKYPEAKIYLATLTKVFRGPDKLDVIEHIFYGTLTNELLEADEEEIMKFNLRRGITIFPWEDINDELSDINSM